jgi:hypothetical protein
MLQILIDHPEEFGALFECVCARILFPVENGKLSRPQSGSKRTPGRVGTTTTSCKLNLNIFNSYYFLFFVSECQPDFSLGEEKNKSHPDGDTTG